MRAAHRLPGTLLAALAVVLLTGCLGSDEQSGAMSAPSAARNPKIVTVEWLRSASGVVDYCTDPLPARKEAVERFEQRFPGLEVSIVELPADTDEQHRLFVERVVGCDVYDSDVIWIADLAARGRVYSMGPYIQYATAERHREFISSTLETARFDGRYWGVPHTTNAGFLFYNTKEVPSLSKPLTWKDVYTVALDKRGLVYQASSPEPLTVNFLEIAFAAGGRILSVDGARSVIDSPENAAALQFMVDGMDSGAARGARLSRTRSQEDKSTDEFAESATFMRNWPKAFDDLKRLGSPPPFDVTPLPIFDGAGVAGVLGGANLVIDDRADNPEGALKLIDFLTAPAQQVTALAEHSEPAVLAGAYKKKEVKRSVSFADELFRAVRQGRPRPVSPAYKKISTAIAGNVQRALSGPDRVSSKEALRDADEEIEAAIASLSNP